MSALPLVELTHVSKGFPGVQALSDVSLSLWPGEIHAVIGENGAGKSTLMNVLAGELTPDKGEVRIEGALLRPGSPLASRAAGIAVVFQELSLCQNLSVGENVMLTVLAAGHGLRRPDRAAALEQAHVLLTRLGMADIHPATPVRQLTVAQMQLVEIARALSREARVLVLDEPNSALSPRETERLFSVVESLRDEGVAIVYVSHHLDEVLRLADRVSVLRDGRHVTTLHKADGLAVPDLVSAMVGRDLDHAAQYALSAPEPGPDVALSLRGLRVPGQIAGIDLDLRPGEILGVAGLPDSGKDVLASAIFGLIRREGTVAVRGQVIRMDRPAAAIAAGIALIPADRRLAGALLSMTVAQNVISSALPQFSLAGILRGGHIRRTAGDYAGRLDARIAGLAQRMSTLSGGNQQKILLARGMVTEPRVLILHEPTRGIDVVAKVEIYDILKRLAAEGMAILMISSELPEIVLHASRVVVMADGRITADLAGRAITEQGVMMAATGSRAQAVV